MLQESKSGLGAKKLGGKKRLRPVASSAKAKGPRKRILKTVKKTYNCANCGEELPEKNAVCPECGYTGLYTCPYCREEHRVGEYLCPKTKKDARIHWLFQSVRKNEMDTVQSLIDNFPEFVNAVDRNQHTPLHRAVYLNYIEMANYLLIKGANPNIPNNRNETPVFIALKNNSVILFKSMLHNGGNLNMPNQEGDTPLIYAIKKSKFQLVDIILETGEADLTVHNNKGQTPLIAALGVAHNHELVEKLIKAGADPNEMDSSGVTPLNLAIDQHNADMARLLLKYGADPNMKDKSDRVPLLEAVIKEDMMLFNFLLEHGADVNISNNKGETPLHMAVFRQKPKMVFLLLQNGAGTDRVTNDGLTPLCIAVMMDNLDIIDMLLNAGVDVNRKHHITGTYGLSSYEFENYTCLHAAANAGNTEAVKKLLKQGADNEVEAVSKEGNRMTAQDFAVNNWHWNTVWLLPSKPLNAIVPWLLSKLTVVNIISALGVVLLIAFTCIVIAGIFRVEIFMANHPDKGFLVGLFGIFVIAVGLIWVGFGYVWKKKLKLDRLARTIHVPLIIAGFVIGVQYIVVPEASVSYREKIFLAAARGDVEMIERELADNPDVVDIYNGGSFLFSRNEQREHILIFSLKKKRTEVAKELLKKGASVHVVDSQGKTPLHYAAEQDNTELASLLISLGANPEKRDKSGVTPLDIAQTNHFNHVAAVMRREEAEEKNQVENTTETERP